MKRALIVAATGGFLNGFLIPDIKSTNLFRMVLRWKNMHLT